MLEDTNAVLMVLGGIALLIVITIADWKLDSRRIRREIESRGGKVVDIAANWDGYSSRYRRAYDVFYITRRGQHVKATCTTSLVSGVDWISKSPPGIRSPLVSDDCAETTRLSSAAEEVERSEGEADPPEPIRCFECGATIPSDQVRCPQCGWSYKRS